MDLHDSHRAVSLGDLKDLPVGAGVNQNDGQYFPVYGWLEVGFQPTAPASLISVPEWAG